MARESGARQINAEQEATSTIAEELVPANSNRKSVLIQNLDATETVYLGHDNTVSSTTGIRLQPNESVRIETTAAVWVEAGANTPSVAFLEEFD